MIYSVLLARGLFSVPATDSLFTAPSTVTTVIRHVDVLLGAGCTGAYIEYNGTSVVTSFPNAGGAAAEISREGRWVLAPGDVITMVTTGTGTAQVYISGYSLV